MQQRTLVLLGSLNSMLGQQTTPRIFMSVFSFVLLEHRSTFY